MSADYHVHTASPRFGYSMEAMAETALKLKLSSLCFTEHMDLDFPGGDTSFHVDTQAYYKKYLSLQECFAEQIELSSNRTWASATACRNPYQISSLLAI